MTTVEAAQAWAEAKEKLAAADAALTTAQEAYKAAHAIETEAWDALQKLSGRIISVATEWPPPPPAQANGQGHYRFDDGFKR